MLNRFHQVFKLICLGFAALIALQLGRLAAWRNPLADVVIPKVAEAVSTNAPTQLAGANSAATNAVSTNRSGTQVATTNALADNAATTNAAPVGRGSTNAVASLNAPPHASGTNATVTNLAAATAATNAVTNKVATGPVAATNPGSNNAVASLAETRQKAMEMAKLNAASGGATRLPGGMSMPSGRRGPGMPNLSVPPFAQGRIDRIIQSEILGAVMRPPPMALLGIAGKDILFRDPNGQTGLLRVGEEMGGVKLLQIRPNRILIEQAGEKKELTIFEGIGSETLLSK